MMKPWGWMFLFFFCVGAAFSPAHAGNQKSFASPEAAVKALVKALKSDNLRALKSIFGPDSEALLSSGDPVADKAGREKFRALYESKNRIECENADKAVLYLGEDDWPFPIPMVKFEGAWYFDSQEGMEEMLARRIGRNELNVIQVSLAYVDAQREYAVKDRDGDGLLAYARKVASAPGKNDGLYWETKEGESPSPMGSLILAAQAEGYTEAGKGTVRAPYHGYYYRILEAQGPNAPGGAYDYVVRDAMVGGFALVAYPAEYGASGVMTFIVNHDGVVYQKDLGADTENIALQMKLFDPDSTWKKVDEGGK